VKSTIFEEIYFEALCLLIFIKLYPNRLLN